MEYLEIDSSSSSSSSSSSTSYSSLSSSSSSSSCKHCSPDSESSADAQAMPVAAVSHKRKAGRKKFKETRHPVFRGVRQRKGNKWVCEVREPHKKSRIWLGTFPCPEMAARAYDVSALALRGKSAALNFPDSALILPRAASSSPKDIQTAALAAAEAFRPITTCCSPPACSSSIPTSNEKKPCLVEETQPDENIDEQKKDLAYSSILDHWENLEPKAYQCNDPLFIDEEVLFNLPGLLDNMAEGMLLSPPPLMQRQVDWDDDRVATINIDLWGYQFTN